MRVLQHSRIRNRLPILTSTHYRQCFVFQDRCDLATRKLITSRINLLYTSRYARHQHRFVKNGLLNTGPTFIQPSIPLLIKAFPSILWNVRQPIVRALRESHLRHVPSYPSIVLIIPHEGQVTKGAAANRRKHKPNFSVPAKVYAVCYEVGTGIQVGKEPPTQGTVHHRLQPHPIMDNHIVLRRDEVHRRATALPKGDHTSLCQNTTCIKQPTKSKDIRRAGELH